MIELTLQQRKEIETFAINRAAKFHISFILRNLDWGTTYEEALADLQNTAISTETKILYLLKPKKKDITLTEVRQKIAEYLAGAYTEADIQNELASLNLTQDEINTYMDLFTQAAEVAKLIYWIEDVWDYVEQKEKEIDALTTIEEIENLTASIQFPTLE